MKKDFTSVIIVNYKTKELTADCIKSLAGCFDSLSYEVIVADNASGDGSAAYLKNLFPGITVIESEKNIGFGSANNRAVKKAAGEYILLLNSDTIVKKNILPAFIAFYKSYKHLKPGVAGSLLIAEDDSIIHSYGNFPFPIKMLTGPCKNKKDTLQEIEDNYFAPTKIVVGADMFMEKTVFDELNGFDENIFLYEEELELQYRMQKKGYTQFIINERAIVHLEGQSSESWFKRRNSFISLCYVNKKHLPYWLYILSRIRMTLYALIFFKNPKTTLPEKLKYLKLTVCKK